ncbi:MAG: FliH/SctL family protein [Burkholderiaceae bacterium]
MSSRIIAADRIGVVAPFRLDALGHDARRSGSTATTQPVSSPDSIRAAAFEEGRRQGHAEGLADAARTRQAEERASAGSLTQRVEAIVADFDQSLAALEESLANRMLGLSLQMAAQVVRTHVDTRPDAVLPPLREAIADVLAEARRLILRVAPADEAVVREALGELIANGRCDLRIDMSLRPGGCMVDSPMAAIDASLETRWRHVLTALGQVAPSQLDEVPGGRIDD